MRTRLFLFILISLLILPIRGFAVGEEEGAEPGTATAEEADVEKIKQKYWARGNETEMGVVQNRLYPKRHRFELGFVGGNLTGDPFLSSYTAGATLGFHFSEFLALHLVAWKAFVSPSSALTTLEKQLNTTTSTNGVRQYVGVETRASVLYGKLSLLGAAILYFDSYFSLGGGRISTGSGYNFLLSAGVGQQIHLSKVFSINLDYKFLRYQETVGNLVTTNLSTNLTVGFSFFLDPLQGG